MFFFVILGLMVLGDIAWWYFAHRRLPRRSLRILAGLFAGGQLAGLALIFVSRSEAMRFLDAMPRWASGMILVWHLLLLLPWMIWNLARGVVALARWITWKLTDREEQSAKEEIEGATMSRRQFLGAAATFVPPLITVGAAVYGEQKLDEFRVQEVTLDLPDLPPALDGMTVAHVTDVHVGRLTRGRVLEQIVEATNNLNADVVALTGDLINDSLRALPPALDMVRGLRARHMVVACEGNHDLIDNPRIFYRESERGGLPLLRGETASVEIKGQRLQVLGMPWIPSRRSMTEEMRQLLAKRDPNAWPLLLAHHPHAWDAAEGIPLTLAGHTHGGQLMLNEKVGFGPWLFRYWSGVYRKPGQALVVSNGTGNWFPVRINAPAEIIHLTLRRKVSGAAI
jgi:uncharacterized protein